MGRGGGSEGGRGVGRKVGQKEGGRKAGEILLTKCCSLVQQVLGLASCFDETAVSGRVCEEQTLRNSDQTHYYITPPSTQASVMILLSRARVAALNRFISYDLSVW